jgi:hypothetical protein
MLRKKKHGYVENFQLKNEKMISTPDKINLKMI